MSIEGRPRPARFADYPLLRFLGEGEGQVFAAAPPPRLGAGTEPVALKIFGQRASPGRFHRAAAELEVIRGLQAAGLVRLYEAGRSQDGLVYCAMELAGDGSLAAPARGLARRDVLAAVARAARAVNALHEAGIVHNALRPGNIVLRDGQAMLTEPDLLWLLWPQRTFHALRPPSHLQYVDPMLIAGEPSSRASDVWSLGATLHVALTARPIYYGITADLIGALRVAAAGRAVIDESLMADEAALVSQCLARDPADRPATALEVAERIERLLGTCPQPVREASPRRWHNHHGRIGWLDAQPPQPREPAASLVPPASAPDPPSEAPVGFDVVSLHTGQRPVRRDPAPGAWARAAAEVTIEGIACPREHLNHPTADYCVGCGVSLLQGPRRPVRGPRPPLGVLLLDDGSLYRLDADYLIGRHPSGDQVVRTGPVRPLRLDDDEHRVDAVHAEIRLDGWRVLLVDRGSAEGTWVRPPGATGWTELAPDRPTELHSRTRIRIAERELLFACNRER